MSGRKEYECTLRIRNFSDENIHTPGSAAAFETEPEGRLSGYLHVFANGMSAEDEGYVRIDFLDYTKLSCETSCVVSVLDASGNRRFPTSYVFHAGRKKVRSRYIMDRAVRRDTLLEEPEELLPEDCLTLHLQVGTQWITEEDNTEESTASFERPSSGSEDFRLPLDSALARRLIGVSSYFRALSEAPMLERQRGYATFSVQEFWLFGTVCDILFGKRSISVIDVDDLLRIYVTAEKYDVPPAVESCRGMLSVLLRAAQGDRRIKDKVMEVVPEFLDLAETLSDVRLKEIVEDFLQRGEDGGREESETDRLQAEWRLDKGYSYFKFERNELHREEEFRFYQ